MVVRLSFTEHLSKPKVTVGLQDSKNGTCVTNLTCVTEQGGEGVTYSWKSLGQATNKSHDGSILPVSWRPGDKDATFICIVRNPISSNTSHPVYAGKLCAGDCLSSPPGASGLRPVPPPTAGLRGNSWWLPSLGHFPELTLPFL